MSILEIFQAGTRPDANGIERTITEAQLDEIVDSYNPNNYRAPILAGHDETKPNKGLIGQLKRIGKSLIAVPSRVDPVFKEQVNKGEYPSISVRLYSPEDKANPVPGKWGLRHVGFPQIPAVKGMINPQFSEDGGIEIEFSESNNGFIDGLIEPPVEQSPIEESIMPAENAETTAELERLRTEVAQLKKQQQENQFSEYLNSLGGKVTPGEKPAVIALMSSLAGDSNIAFAENGATKSQTALEVFKRTLENREIKIQYSESPEAIEPNSDPNAVAREAQKLQREQKAAGNEISFSEAVAQIQKGGTK